MIIDNLRDFDTYFCLNKQFEKVAEFIVQNDLLAMDCGKYFIDGENLYVSLQEYETKLENTAKPEIHKKYIDVQLVLAGEEKIGYVPISATEPSTEYDENSDFALVDGQVEFFKAIPGKFFVFYPQDAHMPCMSINESVKVKKAVFKVKIN